MKRALLLAIAILFITALPAQIDTDLANLLEEGYSVQEMDKIFSEVNYNNHKKWLKNAGYTYVKDKSTSNYFYYDKNAVVTLLLVHENKEIQDVLFHSSPQKYYMAVRTIREDDSYRLVEEVVKDYGRGKFVYESRWVKNGNVYWASVEDYDFRVYKDYSGLASKPTIKSYEDRSAITKAIESIQNKLQDIGPIFPETGSFYNGNQKIVQKINAINESGRLQIDKARMVKDNNCKSTNSFNMHELVTVELKDIYYTRIYVYESKDSRPATYALCIGIKNWKEVGDRKYQFMRSDKNKNCTYGTTWDKGTETNAYIAPYTDCAIALEFTNGKDADAVKSLLDKAIATK